MDALDLIPDNARTRAQSAALRGAFALPRRVKRAIVGAPPRQDGQELALDAHLLLTLQRASGQSQLSAPTVELARAGMDRSMLSIPRRPVPGVRVEQRRIAAAHGDLAARLYRPETGTATDLLVFFHGGGWVIGNLDTHDDLCRFLARHADVQVLSVGYRLAPEHRFPAAWDDAVTAYRFAVQHAADLGATSVSVGGDSAGGNLAASVALYARRCELPTPAFQFLLYPATNAVHRGRSRELFRDGFLLTDADIGWFTDHYVPDVADRADPRLSVLLVDDLGEPPPAYVVTAGFDPLRDEGEEYARRLRDAGTPVVARRFGDLMHGFASLRLPGSRFERALFEIAGSVRTGLALASAHRRHGDNTFA